MADWLGNHQAGKGVHTVDTLDGVDERGSVKVDTPGGAQQMTVRHVPEEWREVGSVPTPGGTTLVTTDVPPSPRNFAPGYPRRIFGPATRPEFRRGYHIHLEGVDQLTFRRVDGPSFRGVDRPVNRTPMKVSHGGHDRERINTFPIFQRLKNAPPSARIIRVQTGVFFEKCFF